MASPASTPLCRLCTSSARGSALIGMESGLIGNEHRRPSRTRPAVWADASVGQLRSARIPGSTGGVDDGAGLLIGAGVVEPVVAGGVVPLGVVDASVLGVVVGAGLGVLVGAGAGVVLGAVVVLGCVVLSVAAGGVDCA